MHANNAASVRAVLLGMTSNTTNCSTSSVAEIGRPEMVVEKPRRRRTARRWRARARADRETPPCGRRSTAPRRRPATPRPAAGGAGRSGLNTIPRNTSRKMPASQPAKPCSSAMNQGRSWSLPAAPAHPPRSRRAHAGVKSRCGRAHVGARRAPAAHELIKRGPPTVEAPISHSASSKNRPSSLKSMTSASHTMPR